MTAGGSSLGATTGERRRRPGRGLRDFWYSISAVGTRELRGRMRGKRAFVVLALYLLLLAVVSYGIYAVLRQQAIVQARWGDSAGFALSAQIGHVLFSGLLTLETLLVIILAPAFTAGAISLEREKQTLELLVVTPLSSLGLVVAKLFSALTWIFLLILAGLPLMAIAFVFGGVAPDDLARALVFLLCVAFGMGAVGLFISALLKRTQAATVLTFLLVIVLGLGTLGVYVVWSVMAAQDQTAGQVRLDPGGLGNDVTDQRTGRHPSAPEALLLINPFVGDLDLICMTAPGGYEVGTCDGIAFLTDTPDQGFSNEDGFGFPRDLFWPRSALAFVVMGVILTILSAQLVAPTRRLRLRRRRAAAAPPPAQPEVTT